MRRKLVRQWKPLAATLVLAFLVAGVAYAVVTQVLRDVPAVARFAAGITLEADNLAVTHDA